MAKGSFSDTVANYKKISQQIKNREFHPVYFLQGEENFFIDKLATEIADSVLSEAERDFNQVTLYGKDVSTKDVIAQCQRYPVMSPYQVVVVRQGQAISNFDLLEQYVSKPNKTTILVFCYQGKSLDMRTTAAKKISKGSLLFESTPPRDYEMDSYVREMVSQRGCTIEPKALSMIIEHIGANLYKIGVEIEKLLTRLPQGQKAISAQDVEDNIGISKDYNAFELTRAISERNFDKALRIVDNFAQNPKNNPLVVNLTLLFNHFQRIVALNIYNWQLKKTGGRSSDAEIMKLLKLSNSYFITEYRTATANYPNAKAFEILGLIRQWDLKSKGMGAGSSDEGELLRDLVLRILMI